MALSSFHATLLLNLPVPNGSPINIDIPAHKGEDDIEKLLVVTLVVGVVAVGITFSYVCMPTGSRFSILFSMSRKLCEILMQI